MNQRIKELATEAGLQPYEDCGPGYVYKMEKFAELIVKDCIKVVYDNVEVALDATGNVVFEDELLKKHFGVE